MSEPAAGPKAPRDGQAGGWAERTWAVVGRVSRGAKQPANWVQLVKFAAVGGSGYVVNLVVYSLLHELGDVHYIPAAIGAFVVAVTNNFCLNRIWTFREVAPGGNPANQGLRFLSVSLAGLGVNLAVLELLVSGAGLDELPSQAIAVAVAMPVNFIGNKLWTFG